jgi:hypothetical protein
MQQKEKTLIPHRLDFKASISAENHTHKAIRVLDFLSKAIKII